MLSSLCRPAAPGGLLPSESGADFERPASAQLGIAKLYEPDYIIKK